MFTNFIDHLSWTHFTTIYILISLLTHKTIRLRLTDQTLGKYKLLSRAAEFKKKQMDIAQCSDV